MKMDRKNFKEGQSLDDNLAKSFFENDNFSFKVYDAESDEDELEEVGEVNWENIKWALQHMSVHYPNLFNDLVHGDADADSCDVWLQLASMKDVVFG
jgi:8-oxo-dGTP pyrophosphatase MutT (NUDIX family)